MHGSMYGLVPKEVETQYSMPFNAYQEEFLNKPTQVGGSSSFICPIFSLQCCV